MLTAFTIRNAILFGILFWAWGALVFPKESLPDLAAEVSRLKRDLRRAFGVTIVIGILLLASMVVHGMPMESPEAGPSLL